MDSIQVRNWNVSSAEPRSVWTVSVLSISGSEKQTGSSESRLDYWYLASVARGVVIAFAATLGLGFNSFIVFAVLANRKLRGKVVNVLHCHLAAVDIVWCIVLLPFPAVSWLYGWWDELCDAYALGRTLMTHATVWTIASLGWDKYRTIASPMRHSPTAELLPVSACLGAIWIAGLLTGAFPFLLCAASSSLPTGVTDSIPAGNHTEHVPRTCSGYFYDARTGLCSASLDQSRVAWYSFFLSVETFCLPLVFLAYCYCHIFRIARWQKKRIAVMAAMVRVITLSVGVPITHENACRTSNQVSTRSRKALRTVCVFLGAFLLCYAPYGVTSFAGSLYGSRLHPLPVALADLLLMTSPTVNAVVYGVRNRMLQQSFRNCVRRKCAQYALKFPGLQDTLLRRFGSPEPNTDQIRCAPEPKGCRLKYPDNGKCSPQWVVAEGARIYRDDGPHTDTLSSKIDDIRNSEENLKRDQVFVEGTSPASDLRYPATVVKNEAGCREEGVREMTGIQNTQPKEQTRCQNGLNIHLRPASKKIVSYENFNVRGGFGVTWKFDERRGSVIEGRGRLVVGADVHNARKASELTVAV